MVSDPGVDREWVELCHGLQGGEPTETDGDLGGGQHTGPEFGVGDDGHRKFIR